MKKFIAIGMLQTACALPGAAAQGLPVIDIGHIVATVANGTVIRKTKDITDDIRRISGTIQHFTGSIKALQYEIREATLLAESVRDLRLADHTQELGLAYGISLNPATFLGTHTFDRLPPLFGEGYGHPNTVLGAEMLHEALDFSLSTPLPTNVAVFNDLVKDKMISQVAFTEMSAKKAIEVALKYNQLSGSLMAKAIELGELVKQDGHFSMTEAERLGLLKDAADYVVQAMELRLSADGLIQDQIAKSRQNSLLLRPYKNNLTAIALAKTPTTK